MPIETDNGLVAHNGNDSGLINTAGRAVEGAIRYLRDPGQISSRRLAVNWIRAAWLGPVTTITFSRIVIPEIVRHVLGTSATNIA